MAANKTQVTNASVTDYLNQVIPQRRRKDTARLDLLFQKVRGWKPRMWGTGIIGYGQYHYTYTSGRNGDFLALWTVHSPTAY